THEIKLRARENARRRATGSSPAETRQEIATVPGGAQVFQRLYTRLGCQGRPPQFVVDFYPYANLMHTIRVQEEFAHVRLSDVLDGAPLTVLEAAAAILLARLYRKSAPRELVAAYRQYTMATRTRRRVSRLRGRRGRRVQTGPSGAAY